MEVLTINKTQTELHKALHYFSCEEELEAFVETVYDDDGNSLSSGFLASIGCSWIDEDFLEKHFFNNVEEHLAFIQYLRSEYSPHDSFDQMRLGVFAPRFYRAPLDKFPLKICGHPPEALTLFSRGLNPH